MVQLFFIVVKPIAENNCRNLKKNLFMLYLNGEKAFSGTDFRLHGIFTLLWYHVCRKVTEG